jgi:glutaredoxin
MKIKVFTLPTCPNCPTAKKIAKEVAEELGVEFVEVDLSQSEGMLEGLMYQIMSTPSIVIDDDVIAKGRIVSKEELMKEAKERLG